MAQEQITAASSIGVCEALHNNVPLEKQLNALDEFMTRHSLMCYMVSFRRHTRVPIPKKLYMKE